MGCCLEKENHLRPISNVDLRRHPLLRGVDEDAALKMSDATDVSIRVSDPSRNASTSVSSTTKSTDTLQNIAKTEKIEKVKYHVSISCHHLCN